MGHCSEYVVILRLLRPYIEKQFPDLNIYLSCRDEFYHIFNNEKNILTREELRANKRNFGYIRELKIGSTHPIWDLLRESNIEIPTISIEANSLTRLCLFVTDGSLPTKSLNSEQIKKCKSYITQLGYQISSKNSTDDVGMVCGVECEQIYDAASKGIKAALIPTGLGTNLFKNMFPKAEILKF